MKPLIIKLGGVLLDNKDALSKLFDVISEYKKNFQRSLIIVHGGGTVVDSLMDRLSLPVVRRNGLRVTPADQIDVIVGSLAGSANTTLLSEAKKQQIASVGLCLADGNSVEVKQISEDLGYVGEAKAGDPTLINLLINSGYLPIISSIGITQAGQMMNVNADHAAVALAKTLNADLILLSDVVGVLDENKQRIESLTQSQAEQLIAKGVITDGMVVKVNSAFEAAKALGRPIDIASWKESHQLIELFNGQSGTTGTRIIA
ncbi:MULTISPECIES: acetylglutamate kinase [Gilliamella]|uniref:acetylglutamate kinase n=1 Tax=Gilliamella TaxID=1193503 RepID=UPI00080E9CA6|nr:MULTISPECIES: acetylglutamate kinase [Gilliamella]MCO6555959.1 acetylglutamate kinase [Gilliamella sp.]MCO6560201.1 acetylglutamate kinase [Gilliamella sp.]NUE95359.1 acetylglutamate kinase [Gilliamella sp. ESL0232]OCG71882.1 acetylglutamate kinase [Gilliamella apicola]OCG77430.1 acetylglutamate kinase [Gilliamella apicola]